MAFILLICMAFSVQTFPMWMWIMVWLMAYADRSPLWMVLSKEGKAI